MRTSKLQTEQANQISQSNKHMASTVPEYVLIRMMSCSHNHVHDRLNHIMDGVFDKLKNDIHQLFCR